MYKENMALIKETYNSCHLNELLWAFTAIL